MGGPLLGGEPVHPHASKTSQVYFHSRTLLHPAAMPGTRAHAGRAVVFDDGIRRGSAVEVRVFFGFCLPIRGGNEKHSVGF